MINKDEKVDPTVNTNTGKPSTPSVPCTTNENGESIDYPQPDINDGEVNYVIDTKCESINSYPHDTNDGEEIKHSAYVIDNKCISDTKTSLNVPTKVPAPKVHPFTQIISTSSSTPSNVLSLTHWEEQDKGNIPHQVSFVSTEKGETTIHPSDSNSLSLSSIHTEDDTWKDILDESFYLFQEDNEEIKLSLSNLMDKLNVLEKEVNEDIDKIYTEIELIKDDTPASSKPNDDLDPPPNIITPDVSTSSCEFLESPKFSSTKSSINNNFSVANFILNQIPILSNPPSLLPAEIPAPTSNCAINKFILKSEPIPAVFPALLPYEFHKSFFETTDQVTVVPSSHDTSLHNKYITSPTSSVGNEDHLVESSGSAQLNIITDSSLQDDSEDQDVEPICTTLSPIVLVLPETLSVTTIDEMELPPIIIPSKQPPPEPPPLVINTTMII